jgi:DNA-binding response OmpR family regulator
MADQSRRALIVEDEPLVCMMAADALVELGFQTIEAGTGAQALKLADGESGALAFALVDLGLPDMPGEQLLITLQERHPSLRIIVASGKGKPDLADSSASSRLIVLPKPYSFEELKSAISQLELR